MSEALLITGKRGQGKSLAAVARIQEYLNQGRTVATNLNIMPEHLCLPSNKTPVFRLPDFPRACDLLMLPPGNLDPTNEARNGLLVLDEAGAFLNARSWQDKSGDRQEVITWLLQSRKYGWDLLMIAQHQRLLDAQVRDSLFELFGVARRLDKIAIPVVSRLGAMAGVKVRMPKLHVTTIRYGSGHDAPLSDRLWYRGDDLFRAYDTLQKIDPSVGVPSGGGYSVLSAWHLKGRFLTEWEMYKKLVYVAAVSGVVIGAVGLQGWQLISRSKAGPGAVPVVARTYSDELTATGWALNGGRVSVLLSDGRVVVPQTYEQSGDRMDFELSPGQWVRWVK